MHALVLYNLRYFTEHIILNLDFQKSIQTLMTDVIDAKVIKLTLFICFGPAKKLKHYWTLVFKKLNEAKYNLNITPCVEIAIFGVPEHGISLTNNMENVFAFASLLARRRILLEWKSKNPPKTSMWICDLILYLKLEKNNISKKDLSKICIKFGNL